MSASLKEVIILTASYYNVTMKPEILLMYVEDLSDLAEQDVINAYQIYRKNPRNKTAPLPSAIREIVRPEIDDETYAISTASLVLEAVSRFGWSDPTKARAHIGEIGWAAVNRFGDWLYVCENLGVKIQPTTFQAQIRDIVKSQVKVLKAGGQLPQLEHFQKNQLQAPQNVIQLLGSIKEVKNV